MVPEGIWVGSLGTLAGWRSIVAAVVSPLWAVADSASDRIGRLAGLIVRIPAPEAEAFRNFGRLDSRSRR